MSTQRRRDRTQPARANRMEAQFVRSNFYRVVHADGAWGGLTPHGQIRMAIYSEAQQFPQSVTYDISSGRAEEVGRTPTGLGPNKLIRELEVDVVLDLRVARSLHDWLGGKITQLERVIEEARSRGQITPEGQHDDTII